MPRSMPVQFGVVEACSVTTPVVDLISTVTSVRSVALGFHVVEHLLDVGSGASEQIASTERVSGDGVFRKCVLESGTYPLRLGGLATLRCLAYGEIECLRNADLECGAHASIVR